LIEELAGIGGHGFFFLKTALGAFEHRFKYRHFLFPVYKKTTENYQCKKQNHQQSGKDCFHLFYVEHSPRMAL